MKKFILFLAVFPLFLSCERAVTRTNYEYTARIVGFDLNCSTCVLEFPDDSSRVRENIGKSENNHYLAVNLSKGDYEIGQLVKVNIRKAEPGDLRACITLYPSYDLLNIVVTQSEDYDNLILNDTISISCGDCLYDPENRFYFCFESVLNDSRCPDGAECFWEGNAEAKFKYAKYSGSPVFFNLNTFRRFTTDTIIDQYKFTLISVRPNPSISHPLTPGDYKADILIQKQ